MGSKNKNANNKKISLLSKELKEVSELCRNLKIDKKELFGGSMTITSLGGIGGSFFTPIINFPEVAILGVGKSQKKQIFIDGKQGAQRLHLVDLDGARSGQPVNDAAVKAITAALAIPVQLGGGVRTAARRRGACSKDSENVGCHGKDDNGDIKKAWCGGHRANCLD